MIGKTISHYKILEKLGGGGMGVVYKAQDLKLDRFVALKFLPPQFGEDKEEKNRFIHEAKAASALDHKNICIIHEIDESEEGLMFIAMAYYEGETLTKKIERGPLKLKETLDIAIQVVEGLAKAHKQGIVHRDIKPANIMITSDGIVKIVDFGLAKLMGRTKLTKTGTTMGTLSYMSPEQASGEEIGHRTDIWSLGVVLYEMVTGQLPFKGEVELSVLYSIINENPKPITALRTGIPIEFERIVSTCLEKEPNKRYQTVEDLEADLRSVQRIHAAPKPSSRTATSQTMQGRLSRKGFGLAALVVAISLIIWILLQFFTPHENEIISQRKMLAVLPFENLGATEDEYFADGITDEITARLATMQGLGVIARTSAIQYKNAEKGIREIGKELGVDYILEGTVRWQRAAEGPSRLRITPQLIKVSDETHLWADIYETDIADIFQLQSDISKQVVAALDIALLQREKQALEEKPTDNVEGYDYYLRGNDYIFRSFTPEDTRIAIRMYEKAIALDSTFAHACARLSYAHLKMYHFGVDRSSERLARAKEALDKAFHLKPNLPEAQLALGYYYYWGHRELAQALKQFAIARKQQPNNSELIAAIGFVQRRQGKWEQSIKNMKKAFELDPRSSRMAINLGHIYQFLRKYSEAECYYDRAISLAPDIAEWYTFKALLYLSWNGSVERSREVLIDGTKQSNPSELLRILATYDYYILARISHPEYQQAITRVSLRPMSSDTVSFYYLTKAILYGQMNRPDYEYAYYDSARMVFEAKTSEEPQDAFNRIKLAYAYAGLGRKQEAVREGEKAVELLPVSKDAVGGSSLGRMLAEIFVMVGEYNAAIDQLEYLFSIPGFLSTAWLQVDPIWYPLRELPRFQKLLEEGQLR
ncbi:MAG: protein kinase [bacterium]